jgi:(1->4)-alpha-D-glucan 1-alpha-D-glucosylmutase
MQKAMREARRNTSWIEPDEEHERRVRAAIVAVVDEPPPGFESLAARVAEAGRRISLAMTLLKLTAPGVPDIYQGDELESLNLVDPDNRRPVDFGLRRRLLRSASPPPKLGLIRKALAVRARGLGPYEPIEASDGVCAFRRGEDVVVATALRRSGGKLRLPRGSWRDLLTAAASERELDLCDTPVALIQRRSG